MIDRQPRQVRHRLGHQLRSAVLEPSFEGGVDLVEAPPRDTYPEIAWEGQHDRPLLDRVDMYEHDRVGAAGGRLAVTRRSNLFEREPAA